MTDAIQRKLAAILVADVVGYSRMMHRDETRTLIQLQRHRHEMDALVAEHDGRIIATGGDSIVVEFPSAMAAVAAAVAMQRAAARHNAQEDDDFRMRWRMGVNVGDVMIVGNDLLGGGVNIAARLESLAEPGGVLISGTVYDQVARSPHLRFEDRGTHRVKNIDEDVRVYRILDITDRPAQADATAVFGPGGGRAETAAPDLSDLTPTAAATAPRRAAAGGVDLILVCEERVARIRFGDRLALQRPLGRPELAPSADIAIGFRRVSRRRPDGTPHAEIRYADGRFTVHDAGSANGSFVDGRYLADATPVALKREGEGSVIELGGSRRPPRAGECRLVCEILQEPAPTLCVRVDPTAAETATDEVLSFWPGLEADLECLWMLATGPVTVGGSDDCSLRIAAMRKARLRISVDSGALVAEAEHGGPLVVNGFPHPARVMLDRGCDLEVGGVRLSCIVPRAL